MWLSFSFNVSTDRQDVLIALLDSIGFEGFEQKENELIAIVPQSKFSEQLFLETIQPLPVSFQRIEVADKNWNEEWERNFQPLIIENKIAVRASFHQPIKSVEHEIIIDPKMSFGTGHHATTEMMMRMMLQENFSGKTVLDFGCGTGILSILAVKLGASSVLAIDNDPWAVENCIENFQLNGVGNGKVIYGDSVPASKQFDFILANITRAIIVGLLPPFSKSLSERGSLLISGFLQSDKVQVEQIAGLYEWVNCKASKSGDWVCLNMSRALANHDGSE
jgi:ribosomal protein L11 methyltransferase